MLIDLTLPIVMASVFTAGWVAIQKLERHAERVGDLLGFLLLLCALLCTAAIVGPYLSVNSSDRAAVIRQLHASEPALAAVRASLNGID